MHGNGEVPAMLWYLFWVATVTVLAAWVWFMTITIHRANMKTLEILRTYAERGVEPPAAIVEPLMRQLNARADRERQEAAKSGRRRAFEAVMVFGCMGLGAVAVAAWRAHEGYAPLWLFQVAVALAIMNAFCAFAGLVLGLTAARD